jgi:hypothetical protein
LKHILRVGATISGGGTLPFAWPCSCLFCHDNDALASNFRHVGDQPPTLFTWSCPADFFLPQKMKTVLEGRRFQDIKNIKNVTAELNAVPSHAFDGCFVHCIESCRKCVAVKGDYLEGDNTVFFRCYAYLFLRTESRNFVVLPRTVFNVHFQITLYERSSDSEIYKSPLYLCIVWKIECMWHKMNSLVTRL